MPELKDIKEYPLHNLRREYSFVPHLKCIGFSDEHRTPRIQPILDNEITFRLGTSKREQVLQVDGKVYRAAAPCFLVKRAGQRVETLEIQLTSGIYFHYSQEEFDKLRAGGLTDSMVLCGLPDAGGLRALYRRLRELAQHCEEPGVVDQIDLLGLEMLQEALLLRQFGSENYVPEEESRIRCAVNWVNLHFMDEMSTEQLARRFHFSLRTFLRRWAATGLPTPAKYIFDLRMQEARRLLLGTDLPVYRIARMLHYRDSAWFCAVFRKYFDQTPLQLRHTR